MFRHVATMNLTIFLLQQVPSSPCDARYPPTKSHLFKILHRLIGVDQAQARRKAAAGEALTPPGRDGRDGHSHHDGGRGHCGIATLWNSHVFTGKNMGEYGGYQSEMMVGWWLVRWLYYPLYVRDVLSVPYWKGLFTNPQNGMMECFEHCSIGVSQSRYSHAFLMIIDQHELATGQLPNRMISL